jgi:tetratricopeptide (TPR) repeat protein
MDRRRPQMPAPAPEVAEAVRQGWLALRGGANRERVVESDAAFRRAFELDPESPDARIGMAHTLAMHLLNGWSERRAEDAATASRLIAETIERNARQPVAFFVQGLVHKSQRDYARGLAAMRVTLQIQPRHAASYAQSAHMYLLGGDADRAIEMAELGVLLGPEANALDRALLYAGMARFLVGDYPAAVRHLERSFAINRTFADVFAWYAAALYRAGRADEARDVYGQMRARWPTHRIDHHVLISHAPQRMERFSTAIAELEARAEFEPAHRSSSN